MQRTNNSTEVFFEQTTLDFDKKQDCCEVEISDKVHQPLIATHENKKSEFLGLRSTSSNYLHKTSNPLAMATTSTNPTQQILSDKSYDPDLLDSKKPTKKWQIFPGKNKFFCDGRMIMALSTGILHFTISLIVITVALFFAFECRLTLVTLIPYGALIPVFCAFLFLFNISCLLRTAWSDPGIIPRATPEEAAFIEKLSRENQIDDDVKPGYRPPPRFQEVIINGVPIKLKYCFTCKIFRPPRASHCSLCDNCVENFDHHCPWVGNCVGKRNYKYFFLFVSSLTLLCVYIFAFSVVHIVLLSKHEGSFVNALQKSPGSVVEVFICFFSVWSVTGLTGFHSYLIAFSLTTNEDIKGTWSRKRNQTAVNPFDHGGILRNCAYTLCVPTVPSALDRRGLATEEEIALYKKRVNTINGYVSTNHQPNGFSLADNEPYDSSQAIYPRQPQLPTQEATNQQAILSAPLPSSGQTSTNGAESLIFGEHSLNNNSNQSSTPQTSTQFVTEVQRDVNSDSTAKLLEQNETLNVSKEISPKLG